MSPVKASGLDGFLALFYQKYWYIIEPDVTHFCISILRGEISIAEINKTYIFLISKVRNPRNMQQFRPISLCNVLYKIIAKVVVNKMSSISDVYVDEAQRVFILGKQISDNVLVAYEILHSLKSKRLGRYGNFALKLDMNKAYVCVERNFLDGMMQKLGLNDSWVTLVMNCVTTVSYTVGVNGNSSAFFLLTHGLRQGDPLSPYLFLLCAEGFSTILNDAKRSGLIRGAQIGMKG